MSGNIQLLDDTLARTREEGRAALIAYLPAGFPTVEGSIEAIKAVLDAGADVVEVGLPHSDPVLDGPVIQTADDIALRGGLKIADVLRTVREAHQATGKPVLVMTYWNPVDRYGVDRFAQELAEAGGAGCILPDLPVQEADLFTAVGSGFVYAASLMGVTGTRDSVGEQARALVERTRAAGKLPVCVGIGVSSAAQAAEVAEFADGVIVGSAFVKRMLDAPDAAAGVEAVRALAAELAEGVRRTG
ncbi:tryptophan synthase subunit alpha [Streptomyces sp. SM8]|uniref:tryptophan synthase subunit alpha n=1 Tax=Streptomyces sp. SM8 TaxID=1195457 RepID=UPI000C2A62D1|nr:tryptophan synthase subunit alpha [Streptomyces sp. SM8]PKA37253.1 tryptophan synthase subunit alpha [Streptomyces sp. SM8]